MMVLLTMWMYDQKQIFIIISTFQGCSAGYYGLNCNESCPFPSYEVQCRLHCTCEIQYCHNVYGCYIEKTSGMGQVLKCTFNMIVQK